MEAGASQIELEPFIHQVCGRSFMLSLNDDYVCKPLVPRELQFYQTIPDSVKKFTPTFKGIVQVSTIEVEHGYINFVATLPQDYHIKPSAKRLRFKLRKTGSIEMINAESNFQDDQGQEQTKSSLNPWVVKCHKENMSHLIDIFESNDPNVTTMKDFILLENLTGKFTYPCILDLKMGTRQYGDTASLAKKQSKMFKVVSTTSAKLGVRVTGMQVYQVPSKHFLCRNKFYGRSLTISGFQQALIQYLHNGNRFRSDVLSVLIEKLEDLANVINKQDAIRFYTTSLLLLYEGNDDIDIDTSKTEDIDKTESIYRYLKNIERQDSFKKFNLPFNNLLRKTSSVESLNSYKDCMNMEEYKFQTHRRSSTSMEINISSNSSTNSSTSTIFEDCSDTFSNKKPNRSRRTFSTVSESSSKPLVDVRIIDFAHSTHKELDDTVVYSGPDRGFLFGLEKLITILKSIKNDYS